MTLTEPKTLRRLFERNPLAVALVLSLLIHLFLFGTWKVGQAFHWWDQQSNWLLRLTEKILHPTKRTTALFQPRPVEQTAPREIPLTFVEIDPATATEEAPKDAKYYSSQNSKASNKDAALDAEVPKADGKQDKVVRLLDNEKPNPVPLQPATPPQPEEAAPKPKGGEVPGELALAKKRDPAPPSDGQVDIGLGEAKTPPRKRPRTVAEAKAQRAMLAGEKIQQPGGVSRRGSLSFDAEATRFGAYDAAFISAVQQRWYDLLEEHSGVQRTGKVMLEFRLTYDGRITNMKMTVNEVGDIFGLLCQSAVLDPAPYPAWPSDMRRAIGERYRDIKFTFFYF